ncbi:MAG: hypothetical protein LBT56_07345 [Prevotellaceae bacterium]|nr:hypothetical protein [Prevotellaceae bacterium]
MIVVIASTINIYNYGIVDDRGGRAMVALFALIISFISILLMIVERLVVYFVRQ